MKIKVIDLLNKIANNEEVPKKIMFDAWLYIYDEEEKTYYDEEDRTLWQSYNFKILTDEVEIIEEPKKIGKIEIYEDEDGHYFLNNRNNKIYIRCDETDFMVHKFNELIDEINNIKENEHEI